MQYADYALWQRALLGSEDDPGSVISAPAGLLAQALAGLPAELALPADRPRPATAVAPRRDAWGCGSAPQVARRAGGGGAGGPGDGVHGGAGRAGGAAVPAGRAATTSRSASPVAGRGDVALDDLVGFFVNTLVLRTDVGGDPSLAELVAPGAAAGLAAYAHQDVPFERLVEVLHPDRSLARTRCSRSCCRPEPARARRWDLPGLGASPDPAGPTAARFDLR